MIAKSLKFMSKLNFDREDMIYKKVIEDAYFEVICNPVNKTTFSYEIRVELLQAANYICQRRSEDTMDKRVHE